MRSGTLSEMKSVWKSLETEVLDDIRRKRLEQLHYRLDVIFAEMVMSGVPRVNAEAYIQNKLKPHNIHFTPRERIRKKVTA